LPFWAGKGLPSVPAVFGLTRSPVREVVQIAGDGFKIKANAFRQALRSSPLLQASLGRYSVVLDADFANRRMQPFARHRTAAGARVVDGSGSRG
jgi:hypothetical protein